MQNDEGAVTLGSYDAEVEKYLAGTAQQPCHVLLGRLIEAVPPSGRVLEIGSGPGTDASYLASQGFHVQPTDASASFLTHLRASGWPGAVPYNLETDDPPEGRWDAVYANAVLHHLRRDCLHPALVRLRRGLPPAARLIASVKTGKPDGWSYAKLDAPRWFTYWDPHDLHSALTAAGWQVEVLESRTGERDDWLDFVASTEETVTLWRPTGPQELALVEASGWRAWPPRLPDQPIFYPVLNEDYATRIASDWNVKASGVGYVTRFEVRKSYLDRHEVHQAGGRTILEYWIPAEELDEFNANIVGMIEVIAEYR